MSYANRQDLETRFGADEIGSLDTAGGGLTVEAALADATAKVDTMISSRYRLPLSAVPEILTSIVCDLARMCLYDESPPEVVTEAGRNALTMLRSIRDGKLLLTANGAPVATLESTARREDVKPVFTRDNLQGL